MFWGHKYLYQSRFLKELNFSSNGWGQVLSIRVSVFTLNAQQGSWRLVSLSKSVDAWSHIGAHTTVVAELWCWDTGQLSFYNVQLAIMVKSNQTDHLWSILTTNDEMINFSWIYGQFFKIMIFSVSAMIFVMLKSWTGLWSV